MDATSRRLLESQFAVHQIGDRSASAAMLAWFLTHVERLDPEEVPLAICDGSGDKGIDALTVNDDLSEVTLYQSKRIESSTKTQGDNDMKNLMGAARYFLTPESVDGLLASRPNLELRRLLLRHEVRDKIAQGYRVRRLVFVSNATLDAAGSSFQAAMAGQEPALDVWHGERVAAVAERVVRAGVRPEHTTLIAATAPLLDELNGQAKLAVALVPATELVKLPGLDDLTLFSRNVRLSAGNTRINRELAKTVADPGEHELFPASHNGITLLTLGLKVRGSRLGLQGVTVVNGCQSLLALHRARQTLTPQLKLLVKVIQLPDPNSTLSDTITYRANNQNAVNIRDQRSTDSIQLDLQRHVKEKFGSTFAYTIKVGERGYADRSLDNTLAAQLIMAAYRRRPAAAVRKVRLFDQDYHSVFSSDIDADKLFLLSLISEAVEVARDDLRGELRSSFSSVRFVVVSLLAELLLLTDAGARLLEKPGLWLPNQTDKVLSFLTERARDVASNINDYVKDAVDTAVREDGDFDAKTVFMSTTGIAPLRREIVTFSRRLHSRDPGYLFDLAPQDA
ncbi:AIPR protein [Geodermatophilus pulveris]|uniref:AIPR protein n=1 Tax=Geodermatophilus pulveris TaxID=1564159 RepID=A0A239HCS4_9ACTN|nr:AIPR family protein [Geodermatophilus pulveris]SNS79092.1 AIPR protein [Geodermatophilus pulveris]